MVEPEALISESKMCIVVIVKCGVINEGTERMKNVCWVFKLGLTDAILSRNSATAVFCLKRVAIGERILTWKGVSFGCLLPTKWKRSFGRERGGMRKTNINLPLVEVPD